jgi:ribonuclease HI
MHSQHVTSAAQDALDALMRKYPPCPLAITSTEATTDPLPDSNAAQDTTLPDAPTTTAMVEKDGWKTVEGKAAQKKRRNDKANNKWAATPANNTPTTKNGGSGKNTHQPRTNTPSAKKTWAEVVKSGGINVQIVLGNGNLGLTTPTTRRGERRGGAGLPRQVNEAIPMGDTTEVFDAELRATHDCLTTCQKIIEYNWLHRRHIHIFTDNQAAILRASRTTYRPGQELARSIHTIATSLRSRDTPLTLHWVPGHTAIPGNDHADLLAKTATTRTPTSPPPVSQSWIRRQIHE